MPALWGRVAACGAQVEQAVLTRVALSLSSSMTGSGRALFGKNCFYLLMPDVFVGNSASRVCFWACWDKAAASCSAFCPSMPPSGRKWSGLPGRVPRWDVASLGSQACEQKAEFALWSREEVRLSCCLGSRVVCFHGRSGAGVGRYCSTFEVNQRKEWRIKILPQEWLQEGAVSFTLLLRPLCFAVLRLWLMEAEQTTGQGTPVLCCCALPFPVLDGTAICGAVLWNRIRKWSDQALQK